MAESKINWLVQQTNPGNILLQSWLSKHGISKTLSQRYVKSAWLGRLAHGVYYRVGKKPSLIDVLKCINEQTSYRIWLSGLTSLERQGYAHYISNTGKIWLGTKQASTLPNWIQLFKDDFIILNSQITVHSNENLFTNLNDANIIASSPEMALIEILNTIPKNISFEHAAQLCQSLVSLSPRKLLKTMTTFNSIKANRLLLFFGHHYDHPWVHKINKEEVNLGKGKRQIIANGYLNEEYLITIPKAFSE